MSDNPRKVRFRMSESALSRQFAMVGVDRGVDYDVDVVVRLTLP